MARSVSEIKSSMIDTINTIDPTIEVEYGPIHDAAIVPISSEIANAEERTDHLQQMFSTEFIKDATDLEIQAYITNFALSEGKGTFSTGNVIFASFTGIRAGETITIPQGTLVGNGDSSLIYETTQTKQIIGDHIDSYYNASERWYEVSVPVRAINPGAAYDLPSLRVRRILTPVEGISIVLNRTKIKGGLDSDGAARKFDRVQNAFQGQDSGSINGLIKKTENYNPEFIKSVAVVTASDRKLFKRFVNQLALDLYINGTIETAINEEHTIKQLTRNVVLLKQPVVSVQSVLLNNQSVPFTVQKDSGVLMGSVRASDCIVFDRQLVVDDVVTLSYTYNSLLEDIKENVFKDSEDNLFTVDMLVREMLIEPLDISATIRVSSSSSMDAVAKDVESAIYNIVENDINGYVYKPEVIRQKLIDTIPGVSDIIWLRFTSVSNGSLNVEVVELKKNTLATVDPTRFLIRR